MAEEKTKPIERVGKAYVSTFVKTSKGLFPIALLEKAAKVEQRTASKQIKTDLKYMADNNLVPLPFAVTGLLTLMDNCSFFDACVRQIAKDVIGQGWALSLRESVEEETEPLKVERKGVEYLFLDPNTEEDSLEDIIERCIIDWGCIGWFGIEVARDETSGAVNGLYHIPASTLRVHRDGNKFCQIRGVEKIWFKRFGYENAVDWRTGSEDKVDEPANELIYYRNYWPQSSWYGAPLILSAVGAVKALIGIRDYNLAFFENYGVPAAIVTVKGCWDEDATKQIADFIDAEIKGSNAAHKTIVLNPPEGGEVRWDPMVVEVKEGHFKLYFKQVREEVLVSYKMPPYRIGIVEIGSLGGSTAVEATRIYIDSVVDPLKLVVERIFSEKIIKDGLESDNYEFDLGELDIRDETAEIDNAIKLFGVAAMSPNEIRESMGKDKLDPDDFPWADDYFISSSYVPAGTETMAMRDEAVAKLQSDIDRIVHETLKGTKPATAVVKHIHRR